MQNNSVETDVWRPHLFQRLYQIEKSLPYQMSALHKRLTSASFRRWCANGTRRFGRVRSRHIFKKAVSIASADLESANLKVIGYRRIGCVHNRLGLVLAYMKQSLSTDWGENDIIAK